MEVIRKSTNFVGGLPIVIHSLRDAFGLDDFNGIGGSLRLNSVGDRCQVVTDFDQDGGDCGQGLLLHGISPLGGAAPLLGQP